MNDNPLNGWRERRNAEGDALREQRKQATDAERATPGQATATGDAARQAIERLKQRL